MILGTAWPIGSQETIGSPNGDKGAGWQAVAPGLVEPVSGEIKIMVPVVGRISIVAVAVDDKVVAGEPVLHLMTRRRGRGWRQRAHRLQCASGSATTNLPEKEKIDATPRMTLPMLRRLSSMLGPLSTSPRLPSGTAADPTPP
jgi:hypothetical protein